MKYVRYGDSYQHGDQHCGILTMKTSHITCKSCGRTGHIEVLPRVRDLNPVCLLVGAIILPLLWCAGRKMDLRCLHCNSRLSARSVKAWMSLVAFWLLAALLCAVIVTFVLGE